MPRMPANELRAMRRKYAAYMRDWKGRTRTFYTPCCGEEIVTPAPTSKHETWDSLTTCLHCGQLFMKVVTYDEARGLELSEGGVH